MSQDPDPARQRYLVLMALRLIGTLVAVIGAAMVSGRIGHAPQLGAVMLVMGAASALVLPVMLARKWKSQRP